MDEHDSQQDFFCQNQDIISTQYEPFEPAAQQINYFETAPLPTPPPPVQPLKIDEKSVRITALLIGNIRTQDRLINSLSKQSEKIDKRISDIENKIIASSELIEGQNKEIKMYLQDLLIAVNVLLGKREIRLQNDKDRRKRKKDIVSTKISQAKNKLNI